MLLLAEGPLWLVIIDKSIKAFARCLLVADLLLDGWKLQVTQRNVGWFCLCCCSGKLIGPVPTGYPLFRRMKMSQQFIMMSASIPPKTGSSPASFSDCLAAVWISEIISSFCGYFPGRHCPVTWRASVRWHWLATGTSFFATITSWLATIASYFATIALLLFYNGLVLCYNN